MKIHKCRDSIDHILAVSWCNDHFGMSKYYGYKHVWVWNSEELTISFDNDDDFMLFFYHLLKLINFQFKFNNI